MSHYKQYSQYKDSGVQWLGKIPKHWDVAKIKRATQIVTDRCNTLPAGMPYIGLEDIEAGSGQYKPTATTSRHSDNSTVGLFQKEDVLYGKLRPYLRKCIIGPMDGACSTEFLVIKPLSVSSVWLKYWLLTPVITQQIEAGCDGAKMPRVDWEHVGSLHLPIPTMAEQDAILATLCRETARIDALIAKKTKFIQLLTKKRQVFITHAVTKGLNPKAKMKDSGVEWIGEVPAHWLLVQLGKLAQERCDGPFGSGLKSEHYTLEGVRVVRLQNIGCAEFKNDNVAFISHEHWRDVLGRGHSVIPGDLLVAGLGDENNPLGRACVTPTDIGDALVKADCYRYRLNIKKALPSFVALSLSATARAECGFMATGATRNRLNLGLASSRIVPLPPTTEEQRAVVVDIQKGTARIEGLVSKTQHSIDLLKKRRSALITAAVTGQIDLRESA